MTETRDRAPSSNTDRVTQGDAGELHIGVPVCPCKECLHGRPTAEKPQSVLPVVDSPGSPVVFIIMDDEITEGLRASA